MTTSLTRELVLDASRADKQRRRVPAVVSTEYPINRGGYVEVLLHGTENVDLTRAPLPLIESHDGRAVNIGLVENLRLSSGVLRGDIVLGTSARANELWPDIEAGIVRNLSIGYVIEQARERGETLEATRWQPYEVSLVSVPADPKAGTYRSYAMPNENPNQPAREPGDGAPLSRGQKRAMNRLPADVNEERERVADITEIAQQYRKYGLDDLAAQCIREGDSVAEFRERAMAKIATQPKATARVGVRGGERSYSISNVIAAMIDPRSRVDIGYELEVSEELARSRGRKPDGFLIPMNALASNRALTVAGAPALVGTEHRPDELIDRLRQRSVVMTLGPRVLSGLVQDQSIPRLTSSTSAQWIAADGVDGLTDTAPGFDSVTLSPHTVGALSLMSRKMVIQGTPDTEAMIRDDFAKVIAQEVDRAAITGLGASNQPRGILNTPGINTGTYASTGPVFRNVLDMEAALMADFADQGALAYLTTPQLASGFKGTEIATGSGQMVWQASAERGRGVMNGLPAYASGNVPLDKIIFGNWSDLLVGLWSSMEITVDPNYDFAKGTIGIRIFWDLDFAVRHPESFAVWSRGV